MTSTNTGQSFRSVVHAFTTNNAWSQFGIDLCLGCEADKPISRRAMMFIPLYLQDDFDRASMADSNEPLVAETLQPVVIPAAAKDMNDTPLTPFRCFTLLFILVTALTIYGIKHCRSLWGLDVVLFALAGVAGCMLSFLTLFSEHPAVSPNYLLLLFQPLHLLLLPWFICKVKKQKKSLYLVILALELTLFIICWAVIPQRIPLAVLPLALCLLERCVSNMILSHKLQ